MKKHAIVSVIAAGVIAAGGVIVAQEAKPAAAPAAAPVAMPAEGRGPKQMWERRFGEMDADKDGKVTLDEFTQFQEAKMKERFTRFDRNADGVLSPDDVPAPKPMPAPAETTTAPATNAPAKAAQ